MKRLILLLILFVNLQIVITHEDMKLFSYSTASAQHMTKEAGDNCQDPVDKLWYRFPFSDCEEVIVTPDGIQIECPYCHEQFTDFDSFVSHNCPKNNMSGDENGQSGGSSSSGSSGSSGGGGGNGGSGSGCGGGNGGASGSMSDILFFMPPTVPIGYPAAAMAGFSYGDRNKDFYYEEFISNEWYVDEYEKNRLMALGMVFDDFLSGYKSELFVKKDKEDNILSYALSFAGTDNYLIWIDPRDAGNDLVNFLQFEIRQYELAYQMAQKMKTLANGKDVTFLGHSLGGGLAALASMTTGCVAITFNPAVVAKAWINRLTEENSYHGTSNIYGYIMDKDEITTAQDFFSLFRQGNFIRVTNKTGGDPHAIKTMVDSLKKR